MRKHYDFKIEKITPRYSGYKSTFFIEAQVYVNELFFNIRLVHNIDRDSYVFYVNDCRKFRQYAISITTRKLNTICRAIDAFVNDIYDKRVNCFLEYADYYYNRGEMKCLRRNLPIVLNEMCNIFVHERGIE